MKVTSTEIQNNFGKYIQLAESQKIFIVKKGSDHVFKLEKVDKEEMLNDLLNSLYGCLKNTELEKEDLEQFRYDGIKEKLGLQHNVEVKEDDEK